LAIAFGPCLWGFLRFLSLLADGNQGRFPTDFPHGLSRCGREHRSEWVSGSTRLDVRWPVETVVFKSGTVLRPGAGQPERPPARLPAERAS
jgi:hypothetical protein